MTNQSKGQKLSTWSWNQWKKKINEKGKTKRRLLNWFSELQGNRVVRPFSHLPPPSPPSSSSTPYLEDEWYNFWIGWGVAFVYLGFYHILKVVPLDFSFFPRIQNPFSLFFSPNFSPNKYNHKKIAK